MGFYPSQVCSCLDGGGDRFRSTKTHMPLAERPPRKVMFEGSTAKCFGIIYSPRALEGGGATVDPGRSDRLLGLDPRAIRAYRAKCVGQADPAMGFQVLSQAFGRHAVGVPAQRPSLCRTIGPRKAASGSYPLICLMTPFSQRCDRHRLFCSRTSQHHGSKAS